MKLNHDCARDILLVREEQLTKAKPFSANDFLSIEETFTYNIDELGYTIEKLKEAEYVETTKYFDDRYLPNDTLCHQLFF